MLDWRSLCCFDSLSNKFRLVDDAVSCFHELNFERWQHVNVEVRRLVGGHSLEMFVNLLYERDVFY